MANRKYHSDFVSYLRQYPDQMEYTMQQELKKITRAVSSDPARAQALAQAYPDPQKRMEAIQQKAAMNAQQVSQAILAQKQKQYGVKEITPATIREAFHEDRAQYEPDEHVLEMARANGVTDPVADFRHNQLPKSVDFDVGRVSPYLFPQQPKSPIQMQPETITPSHQPPRPAPVIEQAPAPMNDEQGSSFTGGGDNGGAPVAGSGGGGDGERMYAPGTEA